MRWRAIRWTLTILGVALATVACGRGDGVPGTGGRRNATAPGPVVLRLGMFPNVTHAPALYGAGSGLLAQALGDGVHLETAIFNAGPAAVEALMAGGLDACFIGPSPLLNAWHRSGGTLVRLVAGCTEGGAALVVRPGIESSADLRGRRIATPQLGNTQDVALRYWLRSLGMDFDPSRPGAISILPQSNAQILELFAAGRIDGAWVPEPWVARLVAEAGGRVLVGERSLWPEGRFPTTLLCVRADYLRERPAEVRRLVEGLRTVISLMRADEIAARSLVNAELRRITGRGLDTVVLESAWSTLTFDDRISLEALEASAAHAEALGFLDRGDLSLEGLVAVPPRVAPVDPVEVGPGSPGAR